MAERREVLIQDPITKVLISVFIVVVIARWVTMIWGAYHTHQDAPPIPEQFLSASGIQITSRDNIISGKAGFQKAGLMDYGSIYGIGSYFGEDYTDLFLVELGQEVSQQLANSHYQTQIKDLNQEQQYSIQREMQIKC